MYDSKCQFTASKNLDTIWHDLANSSIENPRPWVGVKWYIGQSFHITTEIFNEDRVTYEWFQNINELLKRRIDKTEKIKNPFSEKDEKSWEKSV